MNHTPVLSKEVIWYLRPLAGKKYVDATFGRGGHARFLLDAGAHVLGIDRDPAVAKEASSEFKVVQGNFANLKEIAKDNGFSAVEGVLLDLGLGSHQLDDKARGFSFQKEGPLDMRYNQSSDNRTAAELISLLSEKELCHIFRTFGEEKKFGAKIARAIVKNRKILKIQTTSELFELIKKALPKKFLFRAGDTARRIFQALRIFVNEELRNLELALPQAADLLNRGGRIVVISFHSLEDRIVKNFFAQETKNCVCPSEFPVCRCEARASLIILTKKPITASLEEIKINPRSRSAKLRAAEKI